MLWGVAAAFAALDRHEMRERLPSAREASGAAGCHTVSVIAPMRNEAANALPFLDCIGAQGDVVREIIVSDDDSDDETAAIAAAAATSDRRIRVISGAPAEGWVGKTAACERAAREALSEWLLFCDADMRMARGAVDVALAAAAKHRAHACSLTGTLVCGSFLERAVMPAMASVIMSGHPLFLIHSERSPVGLVWGGFVLVRRSAYFAVGGHAAVRGEIAEDRALAERLKAFGFRIRLFDGHELVRVRMYRGAREMWYGWRKNVYEGVRRNPVAAALFALAAVAMLVVPLPALALLGAKRFVRPLRPLEKRLAAFSAISVAGTFITRGLRDRAIGASPVTAFASPVAGIFIAGVMIAATWRDLTGRGQLWKGRTII